jgi:cell division protein FtsN
LRVTSLKPPRPVTASARQAPAAAPRPSVAKPIYLQLSAFSDESNARRAAATLRASLGDILPGVSLKIDRGVANDKPVWRLRAGPFSTLEHGTTACSRIKRRNGTCLVVAS